MFPFAETVHAADVRCQEQPSVRRQLSAGHHRGRGSGRVRHGPPDRPASRRDRRPHARGPAARPRGSQHKHHEQGWQITFFNTYIYTYVSLF